MTQDSSLTSSSPDVKRLISEMNIQEKASLLSGFNFWQTAAIPRLSIPSLKVSDGPNGARGGQFKNGTKAACFPSCVSLAATWDMEIVEKIGKALGEETKTKGASVLLGPTVCPHRHALGGRNFESFSEDPLLAGLLASQFINGLQGEGIAATIKHFAANEQETCRFEIDEEISQRALREIYLKPFEVAIKKSNPWAVMTSYNLINGVHSDMSSFLLDDVLRKQWGWDGLIMSDWTGTNSLEASLNAGLDLEMPGPAFFRKPELIQEAITKGTLTIETLDKRAEAVLNLLRKTGKFQNPEIVEEQAIDLPEHSDLIRKAGAESIVLLKNAKNILPLKKEDLKSVAMLGLSKECLAHGGGSAAVAAHHRISPWEAFETALEGRVEMKYAEGARVVRNLPVLEQGVVNDSGNPGFTVRAYDTMDKTTDPTVYNILSATFSTMETKKCPTLIMTGIFKPTTTGSHYLSFGTFGNTTVYINDDIVFEAHGSAADPVAYLMGCSPEERKQYLFTAGEEYKIRVVSKEISDPSSQIFHNVSGFKLGYITQQSYEANLIDPAIEAAKSSDVVLVFVGHTTEWETEGADRTTLSLPSAGTLDLLITSAAAVNPNTIVINSTGSPIAMPWLSSVAAVIQAWFPGQEAGNSICDVILGNVNPCGKLPVTFPKALTGTPAHGNFPGDMVTKKVSYKEGVYIGYRWFDKNPEAILFPFGFGLSYTSFKLDKFAVSGKTLKRGGVVAVSVDVTNTGSISGREVAQIYIGYSGTGDSIDRPLQQLAGFSKTRLLQPGDMETVEVTINDEFAAYWCEKSSRWTVLEGVYNVFVGTSTRDIHGKIELTVVDKYEYLP